MDERARDNVRHAAVALLKQALRPAADVLNVEGPGWDAEVHREGAAPVRLKFKPWTGAESSAAPGGIWVVGRPGKTDLQRLRERGEDFVALSGAVRLVRDGLLVDRTDLAPTRPYPAAPRRTDPFADRNSLIARTLLERPARERGVRELAAEAGVALGTASHVLASLQRSGVVRVERSGRTARVSLADPARLLRMWFAAYTWERNEMVAFRAPVGDPARFLRRLPALLGDARWALTLQAGASLAAPFATWERVHAYVAASTRTELIGVGEALGWTPADDGQVVLMKPYYRTSVWNGVRSIEAIPVVSDLQLALDLYDYPLRGREQAEHLLATTHGVALP